MKRIFLTCCALMLLIVVATEGDQSANAQIRRASRAVRQAAEGALDYTGLTSATATLDETAAAESSAYDERTVKEQALAAAQADFDAADADWEAAKTETDSANQVVQDELSGLRP